MCIITRSHATSTTTTTTTIITSAPTLHTHHTTHTHTPCHPTHPIPPSHHPTIHTTTAPAQDPPSDIDMPEPEPAATAANPPADAKPKKDKKRKRADPAAVKMSTQVNLLDPKDAAASEAARPGRQAGASGSGAPGQPVPEAMLPYHGAIQACMAVKSFSEATPIQAQCWPLLSAGGDVLGVAEPGSGKTLAYLLPGIAKLLVRGVSERAACVLPVCAACAACSA